MTAEQFFQLYENEELLLSTNFSDAFIQYLFNGTEGIQLTTAEIALVGILNSKQSILLGFDVQKPYDSMCGGKLRFPHLSDNANRLLTNLVYGLGLNADAHLTPSLLTTLNSMISSRNCVCAILNPQLLTTEERAEMTDILSSLPDLPVICQDSELTNKKQWWQLIWLWVQSMVKYEKAKLSKHTSWSQYQ